MMQKLKIAVVPRTFPEVSQTFVLDHVTGLLERGHDLRIFADQAEGAPLHADVGRYQLKARFRVWPQMAQSGVKRVYQFAAALPDLSVHRALCATRGGSRNPLIGRGGGLLLNAALMNAEGKFDMVHAHFGRQGERMAWLIKHRIVSARLVVSLHGFDVNRPLAQGQFPYSLMFEQAHRIIVTTDFMARQAQALGCPPHKLVQLPIGIRTEHFAFAERQWRPQQPLQLLAVARLVPQKGIDYALRAVAALAARGVSLQYTIVGEGPMRAALEALAAELGIAGSVRFTGALNREALAEHFARAHLFLFTPVKVAEGDEEGQGLVVQEAQACGLPVLATRHGGVAEGVLEGRSAVLAQQGDAEDLQRALCELLDRYRDWPAMGRAGREWVEARYSHQKFIEGTEQIYASVMAISEI